MKSESEFDKEVYDLAVKIAQKEFHQHPSIYRCEVLDLAGDLFNFYQHYTKPHIDIAKDPKGFAAKGLYFALSSIRKLAFNESKRIVIESEILDGRFEGNNYFELLEGAGKLNLWDDNEKVINTQENRKASPVRPVSAKSEFSDLDRVEAWEIIKATLNQEEQKIVDLYMDGKTEREMAEATGKSHQAIHNQIKRIIERLTNKGR